MKERKRETYREFIRHHKTSCEDALDWYDLFVDYIEEVNINLYNEACEYADDQQQEEDEE